MPQPVLNEHFRPNTNCPSVFAVGGSSLVAVLRTVWSTYYLACCRSLEQGYQPFVVDLWLTVGWTFKVVRGNASAQSDVSCNDRVVRRITRHRADSYLAHESLIGMADQDVVKTRNMSSGAKVRGLLATFGGREKRVRDSHTRICSGMIKAAGGNQYLY